MLISQILAQSSEETVNSVPSIIAFFIVMAMVIGAISYFKRRGTQNRMAAAGEDLSSPDDVLRKQIYEDKMRRIEQRLRDQTDQKTPPGTPGEPSPN